MNFSMLERRSEAGTRGNIHAQIENDSNFLNRVVIVDEINELVALWSLKPNKLLHICSFQL